MKTNPDKALRDHLLYVLNGGGAHATFDDVLADFPAALRGKRTRGVPYSAWMLLEHMRLAQWDILDFSRNPKYKPKDWPKEYWPETEAPPSAAAWNNSVKAFHQDLKEMQALVAHPKTDLYAHIPWGEGQTILREAILVADHNAYHLGQLAMLKKLLGAWKG
jgi:hypothetical protein